MNKNLISTYTVDTMLTERRLTGHEADARPICIIGKVVFEKDNILHPQYKHPDRRDHLFNKDFSRVIL